MINERMKKLGLNRSVIRELFEYGKALREQIGDEFVFDFSLGNPSVAPPESVTLELKELIDKTPPTLLHGYTSAEGDINVRRTVANYIKSELGFSFADADYIYMTAGAAAALTASLTALASAGESVIALAPYFPEYKVFVERTGAKFKSVLCRGGDFRPDFEALDAAIDETTAAVIINSPNNPTGAVYTEEDIMMLSALLSKKSKEFGRPIYIISDEPYRELVFDGAYVPFIPNYYNNTVVCYSYSKSLSIPGERIGYVFVSPLCEGAYELFRAVCGAGRALGYVCAPSLLQRLIAKTIADTSDINIYKANRDTLLSALTEYGYEVVPPIGAFYLFVKALCHDAKEFSDRAKKYGLLLVPSDDFGCEGYVRIAYCQSPDMINRSLPMFKKLADEFLHG